MEDEQGTVDTLQEVHETPPEKHDEPLQKEGDGELTPEQKEEKEIDEVVKSFTTEKDSEGVKKRIAQLTRKWRTEERARTKLEKEGSESKAVIDEMRRHNQELYAAIQRQTEAAEKLVDVTVDKKEGESYEAEVKSINDKITQLKTMRLAANKEADFDKAAFLEDQIDSLKEQLVEKRNEHKQKKAEPKQKDKADDKEEAAVTAWINSTEWYLSVVNGEPNPKYNPAMSKASVDYDAYLLSQPQWQNASTTTRLAEVKKKIEEKFGYKKAEVKKPPTVEGGGTPPDTSKIALNDEQKHVAHMMFSDLPATKAEEMYAHQLSLIKRGK